MIVQSIGNKVYLKSEILQKEEGLVHFFTTKKGGHSNGAIKGLNLGFRVFDKYEYVRDNYLEISNDFSVPFDKITAAKQTHSKDIRIIREKDAGCGVSRLGETFEADGLITDLSGVPIMVFYADCVPILMADTKKGVIAAVHSGWRGTEKKIVQNAVSIMVNEFGADPRDIKAAIGPSIGACCFETGSEVAELFEDEFKKPHKNGKFKVDLWSKNKQMLKDMGVPEENIEVLGICTVCRSDLLYSYRTHGEQTGRMGAVIMLK